MVVEAVAINNYFIKVFITLILRSYSSLVWRHISVKITLTALVHYEVGLLYYKVGPVYYEVGQIDYVVGLVHYEVGPVY